MQTFSKKYWTKVLEEMFANNTGLKPGVSFQCFLFLHKNRILFTAKLEKIY
jgi:hypothetical protein